MTALFQAFGAPKAVFLHPEAVLFLLCMTGCTLHSSPRVNFGSPRTALCLWLGRFRLAVGTPPCIENSSRPGHPSKDWAMVFKSTSAG